MSDRDITEAKLKIIRALEDIDRYGPRTRGRTEMHRRILEGIEELIDAKVAAATGNRNPPGSRSALTELG